MGEMGNRGGTNVDFDLACRSGSLAVSHGLAQSSAVSLTHLVPGASLGLRHRILAQAVVGCSRTFGVVISLKWARVRSQAGLWTSGRPPLSVYRSSVLGSKVPNGWGEGILAQALRQPCALDHLYLGPGSPTEQGAAAVTTV